MTMPPDPAALAEADRLARAGDLAAAASALEAALTGQDCTPAQWLQLAGLRRALRQPRRALAAVEAGLELAPLDFVALALRAALLEGLDPPAAGPAWEAALAQRPDGLLPPAMAPAIAQGEAVLAAWQAERASRLDQAVAPITAQADPEAAARIARFGSNLRRQTRVYHSEPTDFHFPGLAEREFHPCRLFPWLNVLEAETDAIRAEMQAMMANQRAELVPYLDYAPHTALAQWRPLNRNPDWTAIHLLRQGQIVAANAAQCPRTMAALARLPQPDIPGASPNAMFSLLAPQTAIPPHVGINNARLVCHLPLVVPPGCWFRVGAETRAWNPGEAFVFDDTIEHEAANPSDALRVVLIVDVWHPDLAPIERQAVAAMIAAEGGAGGAL